jgi:hypothetical protein
MILKRSTRNSSGVPMSLRTISMWVILEVMSFMYMGGMEDEETPETEDRDPTSPTEHRQEER